MQMLHGPAMVHELGGQPVEQLWMRWRGALAAEVENRGHQRPTEMPGPDVIDENARGERIPPVGDPVGQGFVQSLAHPAGNITGVAFDATPNITAKQAHVRS